MPDAMAVTPPAATLLAFTPCDRCGPTTRSAEVWRNEPRDLLLSFCMNHATRYQIPMWEQGFRLYMKAPVPA